MAENYFHYPDETIFHGIPGNPNGFQFHEARSITNDNEKLNKLKIRLESYYVNGLNEMSNPFTIAIMTCVGIEVLGQIILGFNSDGESFEDRTIEIYKMLDNKMSNQPPEIFNINYNRNRGISSNSFSNYARVVRKGLRNAFTHSYRSLGVVLGVTEQELLIVDEQKGCLIVNPFLFRKSFISCYENLFLEAIINSNSTYRENALKYFELLIK